ncbi:unnamed protein product [Fusarium graminearum]|nr:unnamed protein product [Fusarium graminearum]CAG1962264.1 unnamed protein product [Fusarium graminearum]
MNCRVSSIYSVFFYILLVFSPSFLLNFTSYTSIVSTQPHSRYKIGPKVTPVEIDQPGKCRTPTRACNNNQGMHDSPQTKVSLEIPMLVMLPAALSSGSRPRAKH